MAGATHRSGVRASPVQVRLGNGVGPPFEMRPQSPRVPPRILRLLGAFMRGGDHSKSCLVSRSPVKVVVARGKCNARVQSVPPSIASSPAARPPLLRCVAASLLERMARPMVTVSAGRPSFGGRRSGVGSPPGSTQWVGINIAPGVVRVFRASTPPLQRRLSVIGHTSVAFPASMCHRGNPRWTTLEASLS